MDEKPDYNGPVHTAGMVPGPASEIMGATQRATVKTGDHQPFAAALTEELNRGLSQICHCNDRMMQVISRMGFQVPPPLTVAEPAQTTEVADTLTGKIRDTARATKKALDRLSVLIETIEGEF